MRLPRVQVLGRWITVALLIAAYEAWAINDYSRMPSGARTSFTPRLVVMLVLLPALLVFALHLSYREPTPAIQTRPLFPSPVRGRSGLVAWLAGDDDEASGRRARSFHLRDLVVLVAVAVILGELARDEAVGPYAVFAASSVSLAILTALSAVRWAARLVRRDLGRCDEAGVPRDLTPVSLAVVVGALATPILGLVAVLRALEHWAPTVLWLRRALRGW